ncbi:nitrite reductase (NADH) large subunit [Sinobaca qinghaiensis]|uniref:Nitrite reductase (NADH) large subunit n=1 Tax=Sinobaca qinghaiensis TaxID=342944 RepID=A0A419V4A5_9BACL|nr:nitrite reductase large subunit NirB [Sinobaca qinghaiensis]RKD73323.1 nitrite reductase (NADH) large subunit [Sinobaca qinghaiensis]
MNKEKVLLIGNGMAGLRFIEELLETAPKTFDITIIGEETGLSYNRMKLSSYLQGEAGGPELYIHPLQWYEDHHIELITGTKALYVDQENRVVRTDDGTEVAFDKAVIATGSKAYIPPVQGADKENVFVFRTMKDCEEILDQADTFQKAAVIGGGLLGLEAARGLLNRGLDVTVVHRGPFLMNRQLDEMAAGLLQEELEKQGMHFLFSAETKAIKGLEQADELLFEDGTSLAVDAVVMAAGIKPQIELAGASGIPVNKGIIVNDWMETEAEGIYALGECAEHRGTTYGLVAPLYEQAKVLAASVSGKKERDYSGSAVYTRLKIPGVEVFSAGSLEEESDSYVLQLFDEKENQYRKIIMKEDMVQGAVLYGSTNMSASLQQWIKTRKPLSEKEKQQLLSVNDSTKSRIKTLSSHAAVCHCNNVSKGTIIKEVQTRGLCTAEEVKACTGASSSCGGCRPVVEELLDYMQSDEFNEHIEKIPFCECTDLEEEEVVSLLQDRMPSSLKEAYQMPGWKTDKGCGTCREALPYYLYMISPAYFSAETGKADTYENIIERSDGSLAVHIPGKGGGFSLSEWESAAETASACGVDFLKPLPDGSIEISPVDPGLLETAAEKLGLQRMGLPGNRFPAVQIRSLEKVECACTKQPEQEMAVWLEKRMELLPFPTQPFIRMSSCSHNCADIQSGHAGILYQNEKWELRVAVEEKNHILFSFAEQQTVLYMLESVLLYYRISAGYGETLSRWVERVTMVHIREVLFQEANAAVLLEQKDEEQQRIKELMLQQGGHICQS